MANSSHPMLTRDPQPRSLLPAYKTTLCKEYFETGSCEKEDRCRFAHGDTDLRLKHYPPRLEWYKTKKCQFHHKEPFFCPHGAACWFLRDEVSESQECPLFKAIGTCYFFGSGCPFKHNGS